MKRNFSAIAAIVLTLFVASCTSSVVDLFRMIERSKAGLSEKSVTVGNHKIVYLEGGKGEPVLLLHGFGANKDNWTKFASYLTKKYRVIAIDNPGFGDSTKLMTEKYDLDSQIARIHEFAVKTGLKKFHIAGNSMGGMFSGIYAVRYPDEILSAGLIDAAGIKNREKSEFDTLREKGENPLIINTVDDFDKTLNFVFVTPPSIPGSVKKYLAMKGVESRAMNEKIFSEIKPGSQLEDKLKNISAKTLLLWGDRDRIFPVSNAYAAQKLVKNSQVVVIKNCGHSPMVEKPEETAKYYLEFLAGK